jgi:hypothetical protein
MVQPPGRAKGHCSKSAGAPERKEESHAKPPRRKEDKKNRQGKKNQQPGRQVLFSGLLSSFLVFFAPWRLGVRLF